jgi:hypothetical protein
MPFKSLAQERLFFAKEKRGELPKGTAERWARHTPSQKALPEHVKHKKSEKSAAVATEAEVNEFVKAAMARYAELGVPKDVAAELFSRKMTKVAEQLGLAMREDPNTMIVKLATAQLVRQGIPEAQAKVMVVHELSKLAYIEKIARVKKGLMDTIKQATPQDDDLDAALAARGERQKKLVPPPPPPPPAPKLNPTPPVGVPVKTAAEASKAGLKTRPIKNEAETAKAKITAPRAKPEITSEAFASKTAQAVSQRIAEPLMEPRTSAKQTEGFPVIRMDKRASLKATIMRGLAGRR